MARIDLNDPYNDYLQSQVSAGLFRSVTAAAEAAIHKQMVEDEQLRFASIGSAIAKGELDIQAGRTVPYRQNLMAGISEKGKKDAINGKSIKPDARN